jgi:hypothetical protein
MPSLKEARDFLEPRWREECERKERIERLKQRRLPQPIPQISPEERERVRKGFAELKLTLQSMDGTRRA